MLGAGGPALGVFLLGSLMWNVDLSRGPEYREGAPQVFSHSFFYSVLFLSNLETMSVFLPRFFGSKWEGLAPKKQLLITNFGIRISTIIFSWLTLFSNDLAYKFATYKTRSGLKTTGFMTCGIANCWTHASIYPQARD